MTTVLLLKIEAEVSEQDQEEADAAYDLSVALASLPTPAPNALLYPKSGRSGVSGVSGEGQGQGLPDIQGANKGGKIGFANNNKTPRTNTANTARSTSSQQNSQFHSHMSEGGQGQGGAGLSLTAKNLESLPQIDHSMAMAGTSLSWGNGESQTLHNSMSTVSGLGGKTTDRDDGHGHGRGKHTSKNKKGKKHATPQETFDKLVKYIGASKQSKGALIESVVDKWTEISRF